jgi:hypothetical protein
MRKLHVTGIRGGTLRSDASRTKALTQREYDMNVIRGFLITCCNDTFATEASMSRDSSNEQNAHSTGN